MKLNIFRRYYEYKKWFAWYPVYWDYEGGKWIWLEFVYRTWDSRIQKWVYINHEQYLEWKKWHDTWRKPKETIDEWDTSAQNDKGNDCKKPPVIYSTKYEK